MSMPALMPIQDIDLKEFCEFLHKNLNQQITTDDWVKSFCTNWIAEKPNNGFLLRDDEGEIVGGIGAIYSQQIIHGKAERFCNITSWCVLNEYRSQSMRLAMAITTQKGYHFTDLTPTAIVAKSLQFLKFKPLNSDRTVIFNLPWPLFGLNGVHIITAHNKIDKVLPDNAAKIFRDNCGFPWLQYVAVGRPGAFCLVIFRQGVLKKLPCANIIGLSDPALFLQYQRTLGNYLLFRFGMVTTLVESRFLTASPLFSVRLSGYIEKMYHSDTLKDSDITNLYSELVCLNT